MFYIETTTLNVEGVIMGKERIILADISKSYYSEAGVTQALHKINLTFCNGEFVAVTGESGSGKSTLLSVLGGILSFDEGEMTVDGDDTFKYDEADWEEYRRNKVSFVFQDYSLVDHMTVLENVVTGMLTRGISTETAGKKAGRFLEMTGLSQYAAHKAFELSSGQKQRLSIARALAKETGIILADEPTGSLDEENTLRTMSVLKALSKTCLVLLVSHEKRVARFFSDRMITISGGKIISDEEILDAGNYEREDDQNIYLGEMEKSEVRLDGLILDLYKDKTDAENIRLTLAVKNGRLYIKSDDRKIMLAGDETGVNLNHGVKEKIEKKEIENFSFQLEKPKVSEKGKNAEARRMTIKKLFLRNKRQVLMGVVFVLTAIMVSVASANLMNIMKVDKDSVLSSDPLYMQVDFTKVTSLLDDKQREDILDFVENDLTADKDLDIFYSPKTSLYLKGDVFKQLENVMQAVPGFSFGDVKRVYEKNLVYGKLPAKYNEVAVDEIVIKKLAATKGVLGDFYEKESDYVGAKLYAPGSYTELTISAIVKTGMPDIYADTTTLCGMAKNSVKIMTPEEYALSSGKNEPALAENEIFMRDGLFEAVSDKENYHFGDSKDDYKIKGTFEDGLGADFIVHKSTVQKLVNLCISGDRTCMVMTDEREETEAKLYAKAGVYSSSFHLEVTCPYEEELTAYITTHRAGASLAFAFLTVFGCASLVMIFFVTKSIVAERTEEFTVCRLIGIRRKTILNSYLVEMFLFTTMTTLPAVILTWIVIKMAGSVPTAETGLFFPWWCAVCIVFAGYILNALISLLQVSGILRKPPVELNSK